MGKNTPRTIDGSKYNVWVVLDLANSYYEMSTTFTKNLPSTIDGLMGQRFLGVASATNRILALELYLKAILVGQAYVFTATHDLAVLFNELPEFIRQEVERMFNERMRGTPKEQNWSMRYFFGVGEMPSAAVREQAEEEVQPLDGTLTGLLERNKGGFIASRYLFEDAVHGKVNSFNYEHRALGVLCGILCEGLEHSMQGRNPNYQRRFHFEEPKPTFAQTNRTFFTRMTGRLAL